MNAGNVQGTHHAHNSGHDREPLLHKLISLDFAATDLALYLDTHPDDEQALRHYNHCVMEADDARCSYEDMYGPLCSYRSLNNEGYEWLKEPWPWEAYCECALWPHNDKAGHHCENRGFPNQEVR